MIADFRPGHPLLFIFHGLPDFLAKQMLDFILHCLGAGGAEMRPCPVAKRNQEIDEMFMSL